MTRHVLSFTDLHNKLPPIEISALRLEHTEKDMNFSGTPPSRTENSLPEIGRRYSFQSIHCPCNSRCRVASMFPRSLSPVEVWNCACSSSICTGPSKRRYAQVCQASLRCLKRIDGDHRRHCVWYSSFSTFTRNTTYYKRQSPNVTYRCPDIYVRLLTEIAQVVFSQANSLLPTHSLATILVTRDSSSDAATLVGETQERCSRTVPRSEQHTSQ